MQTSLLHAASRLASLAADTRSDAHLVAAFLSDADQHAFAELVRRHGPSVLGVCRRFLGPTPDAEDAFQATFLVLVRRARGTEWRGSLGPWLYGVALRVARKARAVRARHRANERQATAMTDTPTQPAESDDAAVIVDEELMALPAVYRLPLVLCEIQGVSRRDAARELGLVEGTLSSRLARGRKMLRDRLARRGVAPVVFGLAATVPAQLANATVHNAVNVLMRVAGAVPVEILSLTEGMVKTMIGKWKLAAVMLAACVGLTGFGAWQTSAQPTPTADRPAAPAAPPEKAHAPEKTPATKLPEPVATIFGNVPVSREAFADHLIRRYGKKELEMFVNKQIIAHAFGRRGWVVSADDLKAAIEGDCKALGLTREKFTTDVLPRYGKTLDEWTEDVIVPRLMLAQLCKAKMPAVTEAELRQAFDAKYGERLSCRVITWAMEEGREARRVYTLVRDSEEEFDRYARRSSNANLAAVGGLAPPIPRAVPPDATEVQSTAAKLKAGEVSPLIATADGFIVVKCVAVTPADKSKVFDKEKAMLLADVHQAKLNNEIPKLFNDLKQQADPKFHLTFPDPVPQPQPTPSK